MKRTLIRNNLIIYSISFIVFFTIVSIIMYWFNQQKQTEFMHYLVDEVELSYQVYSGDASEFIIDFTNENDRRITILDQNGLVIADSHDSMVGTDKSMRPEIQDLGSVVRRNSATIGLDLIYTAKRMNDGNILRVSVPLQPQIRSFNYLFIWLFISGGFLMVINTLILKRIGENLYEPWLKVKDNLVMLREGKYQVLAPNTPYQEINQIIHEMNTINLATAEHVNEIEDYQTQLNHILDEMEQSVILVNQENDMLFFNEDAKSLFKLEEKSIPLKTYEHIREIKINEAIQTVNQTKQMRYFDQKINGKLYEIRVFPVNIRMKEIVATVLLTLKNVTEERSVEMMKKDFFSHASHELKSPLTAIKGYAELIEFELVKKEEVKQMAQNINKQVNMMNALVEDMLMLSRLENIKEIPNEKHHLNQVLDQVLDQLKPLANEKSIEFTCETEDIVMHCDQLDMHKLFKNLIENSIKYSDPNKKVQITLKKKNEQMIFIVKDQGYGIAKEYQSRVFERFYRIEKGRLDSGTGLGLAIVKHIVLKYQGKINLESSLNNGTKITIEIPYK